MPYETLIHGLWPIGLVLQGLLAGVLLSKKAWQKFPFFTSYSLVSFVTTVALFGLRNSPKAYFYTYWPFEALGILLELAIVYEVFRYLFTPYPALRRIALNTFQGVILVLLIVALAVFYKNTATDKWHVLATALFIIEESARILELGFLIFLFIFSRAFHLYWKQAVFGMALGLGVFVSVELLVVSIHAQFDTSTLGLLSLLRMLSFNAGLVIWITYMLVPDVSAVHTGDSPTQGELERWDQTLRRFIYQ